MTDEDRERLGVVLIRLGMLRNDLDCVVEANCAEHGRWSSGPNLTVCLLCLIACEFVGALMTPAGGLPENRVQRTREQTRWFLRWLGDRCGDPRYDSFAGLLIVFFRHGIAHQFLPKAHSLASAAAVWAARPGGTSECVQKLKTPSRAERLADLRAQWHLVLRRAGNQKVLLLCPQVFYLDLSLALDAFTTEVQSGDGELAETVLANLSEWSQQNAHVSKDQLTQEEWAMLERPVSEIDPEVPGN